MLPNSERLNLVFIMGFSDSLIVKCFSLLFFSKCALSINFKQIHNNICDNVVCEPVITCPYGLIKMKVGYNGCCDACVTKTDSAKSSCQRKKDIRLKILEKNEEYTDNLWIPACEDNGDYKLVQARGKKTVCVNNDGINLFGQDISEMSQNISCECSQHIHNMKIKENDAFMIKPQEHCTSNGNFEKIQCIDNLCYCASRGEVEGKMVRMDHIHKLSCCKKKTLAYVKPCEKELIRAKKLRYQFLQKGINVLGLETVECDPDGTFSPTQCDSSRCSCTNEEGIEIGSYFTEDVFRYIQMGCGCARDNEKAAMHAQYPVFKCDKYGNFNSTQCVRHSQCFCVDKEGDIISKELNMKELNVSTSLFCNKLLDNLSAQDPEKLTFVAA